MRSNRTSIPNRQRLFHVSLLLLVDFCWSFQAVVKLPTGRSSSDIRSPSSQSWTLAATIEGAPAALAEDHDDNDNDNEDDTMNASTLRSVTFRDLPQDQEPQLLGNFLMELGACSISITDADAGTDSEMALFDEFDPSGMTRTAVATHVWGNSHLTAHFPASTDLSWIMEIVRESFPELPLYDDVTEVEDKDWVLHVQQSWKPILLPPFCLRFPWHTDELVESVIAESSSSSPDDVVVDDFVHLQLQGGVAFGTGEHPTTQMCLNWIGNICSNGGNEVKKLMDYGAGSGVLGMAACKLDDTLDAVGVDIDVDAVMIANENSKNNKVGMKNYLSNLVDAQDDESQSVLLKAYRNSKQAAEVLPEEWDGPIYDAVVANILAGPLVVLAPHLTGLLKPGGKLGLSGIMTSQSQMILDAYEPFFDNLQVEQDLGGWVLVTGNKNLD